MSWLNRRPAPRQAGGPARAPLVPTQGAPTQQPRDVEDLCTFSLSFSLSFSPLHKRASVCQSMMRSVFARLSVETSGGNKKGKKGPQRRSVSVPVDDNAHFA
jgi:hypothetical protein